MGLSLSDLPERPLLHVLQHLDARRLLLLRGVCRRLRDLALHPTLWLRESLAVEDAEELPFQLAVLGLAPRLAALSFRGDSLKHMDLAMDRRAALPRRREWSRMARLAVSTCCAVKHLSICVSGRSSRAASILRNQMALPTFRVTRCSFSMAFTLSEAGAVDAVPAWLQLFAVFRGSTIPELDVDMQDNDGWQRFELIKWPKKAFAADESDRASLKKLRYTLAISPDPVLHFLLKTHASTLERVVVDEYDEDFDADVNASEHPLVALLARCSNLRDLRCHLPTDISSFQCAGTLEKLAAWCHLTDSSAGFLQKAIRLRSLTTYPTSMLEVEALSSSGLSALESLCFYKTNLKQGSWERLAAALPGLPRLRKLKLDQMMFDSPCPPVSFLKSITPATAPSLRLLRAECTLRCPKPAYGAGQVDFHEVAVELLRLLRRMPGLHIDGLKLFTGYCNEPNPECGCSQCSEGGSGEHQSSLCSYWFRSRLDGFWIVPVGREFMLFSHAPSEPCDLHETSSGLYGEDEENLELDMCAELISSLRGVFVGIRRRRRPRAVLSESAIASRRGRAELLLYEPL